MMKLLGFGRSRKPQEKQKNFWVIEGTNCRNFIAVGDGSFLPAAGDWRG
jgi:hypothetical protein